MTAENWRISGPEPADIPQCEHVLRSLPDYFGIESAIVEYMKDIADMPTYHASAGNRIIGFLSINRHTTVAAEIHVMGVMPQASAARLRVEVDLPADETYGYADRDHLYTILRALIDNACLYTPPGGVIRVRVNQLDGTDREGAGEEGGVEVVVADTGIGIPPEEQEQIFDAFFRGRDEYVRTQPGNGLGLAVAKGLVELQGGVIRCESQPGQGSKFAVILPRVETDEVFERPVSDKRFDPEVYNEQDTGR